LSANQSVCHGVSQVFIDVLWGTEESGNRMATKIYIKMAIADFGRNSCYLRFIWSDLSDQECLEEHCSELMQTIFHYEAEFGDRQIRSSDFQPRSINESTRDYFDPAQPLFLQRAA
jgi:hypothetical protein